MKKDYIAEIKKHLQAIKNLAEEARDNGVSVIVLANVTFPEQKESSLAVVGRTYELRDALVRMVLNDGSLPVMKTIIKQVGVALYVYEVSERLGISPDNLSDFFDEKPKPKNEPPLPHPKCEA
ncbi:MAG: hypothetical protein J5382_10050 [Bacteroidales bacterium]|nr:hypothetical protein [Bacteroidales bacterium]